MLLQGLKLELYTAADERGDAVSIKRFKIVPGCLFGFQKIKIKMNNNNKIKDKKQNLEQSLRFKNINVKNLKQKG